MKRNWLIWAVAAILVAVIGGSMFALGRMSGGGGGQGGGGGGGQAQAQKIRVPKPSPEEEELQKIKIAASEVSIEEARKGPEGWVVRVSKDSSEMDLIKLAEEAAAFFEDLDRSKVEIAETSYEVRTSDLKDVWGNTLKDVSLLRIGLDKATFDNINWQGFDPKNFPRITDDFWMHDLLMQKMLQNQQQQNQGGGQGGASQGRGGGQDGRGGNP